MPTINDNPGLMPVDFSTDIFNQLFVETTKPKIKQTYECSQCNNLVSSPDYMRVVNETQELIILCSLCLSSRKISSCNMCGSYHLGKEDLCSICKPKVVKCNLCTSYYEKDSGNIHTISVYGEPTTINTCRSCNQWFFMCSKCENIFSKLDITRDYSDGPLCYDCANEKYKSPWKREHDYAPYRYIKGNNPIFNLIGKSKRGLYLGVENEVQVYKDFYSYQSNPRIIQLEMSRIVSEYNSNTLYLKHDGTIGGEPAHGATGFEVVLQPHTFRALKTADWSSLFSDNTLRHKTCGMHIHMTKSAFTTLHLYKFLFFIYLNQGFIERLGERKLTKYCTPNSKDQVRYDAKYKFYSDKGPDDIYRRQMVNLCNKETVELRFFANAHNKETFMKNIEFAHALYIFSLDTSLSYFKPTKTKSLVSLFCRFVSKHHLKYNNLHSFIQAQKNNKGAK